MIVNMIRFKPQIYEQSLTILKDRCSQRQTPHNLSFRVEDVGCAIEMLSQMEPRQPLTLADDLCEYSRNLLHVKALPDQSGNDDTIQESSLISQRGGSTDPQPLEDSGNHSAAEKPLNAKVIERRRKSALKAQQRQLVKKYTKVK